MNPAVHISNASFNYEENMVFRDVNLDIFPGEVLCLLGPNGCGKTTLLRCINGALKLRKGNILLGEKNMIGGTFYGEKWIGRLEISGAYSFNSKNRIDGSYEIRFTK